MLRFVYFSCYVFIVIHVIDVHVPCGGIFIAGGASTAQRK